jgi:hypothetical protein
MSMMAAVAAAVWIGGGLQEPRGGWCGTPGRDELVIDAASGPGGPGDCGLASNAPDPGYAPAEIRELQIVVHVIERADGLGHLAPATIHEQIALLNEHFRATPGTPGDVSVDTRLRFALASFDPTGAPTGGITYTVNDAWFADGAGYWTALAWDPTRYVNVYTNSAGSLLGYVPDLPQSGVAGAIDDRIVLAWDAVGSGSPVGAPYDLGKVLAHEMGHYLGLWHTFQGGCDGPAGCHSSGDLICDTAPELLPMLGGCVADWACGGPSSFDNYMSYSAHSCQVQFTEEQARRMRCTLEHWRPLVSRAVDIGAPYCPASPNSAGPGARLRAEGSTQVALDDFALLLDSAPAHKAGLLLLGANPASTPFGDGTLCVSGSIRRIPPPVNTDGQGQLLARMHLAGPILAPVVAPGNSAHFQFWFRDPAGGPAGNNLSNGLAVTWR